jgi:hypothetical protein
MVARAALTSGCKWLNFFDQNALVEHAGPAAGLSKDERGNEKRRI